jgi:hypothetical protein
VCGVFLVIRDTPLGFEKDFVQILYFNYSITFARCRKKFWLQVGKERGKEQAHQIAAHGMAKKCCYIMII